MFPSSLETRSAQGLIGGGKVEVGTALYWCHEIFLLTFRIYYGGRGLLFFCSWDFLPLILLVNILKMLVLFFSFF